MFVVSVLALLYVLTNCRVVLKLPTLPHCVEQYTSESSTLPKTIQMDLEIFRC